MLSGLHSARRRRPPRVCPIADYAVRSGNAHLSHARGNYLVLLPRSGRDPQAGRQRRPVAGGGDRQARAWVVPQPCAPARSSPIHPAPGRITPTSPNLALSAPARAFLPKPINDAPQLRGIGSNKCSRVYDGRVECIFVVLGWPAGGYATLQGRQRTNGRLTLAAVVRRVVG